MKSKKEKTKKRNQVLIIVGICVIVVSVSLFFILKDNSKNKFEKNFLGMNGEMPENFQGSPGEMQIELTNEEISKITEFLDSSPAEEVENYCQENMFYCMHYCRENSESNYCKNLIPSDIGNRTPPEGMGGFPKK